MDSSFEFVDESLEATGWVEEVHENETKSQEFSILLKEVKNLRSENEEIRKSVSEIRDKLTNVLEQFSLKKLSTGQENGKYCIDEVEISQEDERIPKNQLKSSIEECISGEWKMISSRNVDEFLQLQQDISLNEATRIRSSNICFEVKSQQIKTCNFLNGVKMLEIHFLPFPNRDGVQFSLMDNKLISVQNGKLDGHSEETSRIERFIENGNLKVVWRRNGLICERIYEKLENWSSNKNPFNKFY